MIILDKYISSTFLKDSVIIVFSVCFVAILTRIVQYSEIIFGGEVGSFYRVFLIFALILPKIFSVISPFGLCFAAFFLLNKISTSSELAGISSIGYPKVRIIEIYFLVSFIFFVFNLLCTFFLIPLSYKSINKMEREFNNEIITNLVKYSTFSSYGDYIFYIDSGRMQIDNQQGSSFLRVFAMQNLDCIKDDNICANIIYSAKGSIGAGSGFVNANLQKAFVIKRLPSQSEAVYSTGTFDRFEFQISVLDQNTRDELNVSNISILELIKMDFLNKDSGVMQEFIERITPPFLNIILPCIIAASFFAFITSYRGKNSIAFIKIVASSVISAIMIFLPMVLRPNPILQIILFFSIICLIIIFLFLLVKKIK